MILENCFWVKWNAYPGVKGIASYIPFDPDCILFWVWRDNFTPELEKYIADEHDLSRVDYIFARGHVGAGDFEIGDPVSFFQIQEGRDILRNGSVIISGNIWVENVLVSSWGYERELS